MNVNVDNLKPRRVWLGLTVPGKKMVSLLEPEGAGRRGFLIDLYADTPHKAILVTGMALNVLPSRGAAFGPAFRRLFKQIDDAESLYGAAITDIRDFLKFRFRANGLQEDADTAADIIIAMNENTVEALLNEGPSEMVFTKVVNYTITALDNLSRSLVSDNRDEVMATIASLRDLVRFTARWSLPWRDLEELERYDKYDDAEAFREPSDQ